MKGCEVQGREQAASAQGQRLCSGWHQEGSLGPVCGVGERYRWSRRYRAEVAPSDLAQALKMIPRSSPQCPSRQSAVRNGRGCELLGGPHCFMGTL